MINITSMIQEQQAIRAFRKQKEPLEIMNMIVEMKDWVRR